MKEGLKVLFGSKSGLMRINPEWEKKQQSRNEKLNQKILECIENGTWRDRLEFPESVKQQIRDKEEALGRPPHIEIRTREEMVLIELEGKASAYGKPTLYKFFNLK